MRNICSTLKFYVKSKTLNKELITTMSNQKIFVLISEAHLFPFPIFNNIFHLPFYTVKKVSFIYVRILK